jgi:hypothetical protein
MDLIKLWRRCPPRRWWAKRRWRKAYERYIHDASLALADDIDEWILRDIERDRGER